LPAAVFAVIEAASLVDQRPPITRLAIGKCLQFTEMQEEQILRSFDHPFLCKFIAAGKQLIPNNSHETNHEELGGLP
jgi:hypothetical protein